MELDPDISEMYGRLQKFLEIVDTGSYALQRTAFATWLQRASSDVSEIKSAAKTVRHWKGYIQNTRKSGSTVVSS